jgi:two-component system sensor histidine kinase KdpD
METVEAPWRYQRPRAHLLNASNVVIEDPKAIESKHKGRGIAVDRRASLFTRYGLGEVRSGDSTGLGLFLVRTFVSGHGGRVSVDCPAEGGSVFTVELPVSERNP